jgi:TonB family protein
MKTRLVRLLAYIGVLSVLNGTSWLRAQTSSYLSPAQGRGYSAVDAKGTRHTGSDYAHKIPPWMLDCTKLVGYEYSNEDRFRHRQGRGLFRLTLDLKTGVVTQVAVQESTGFPSLDRSAINSLKRWRWKPGKWREIVMPVTYVLTWDRSLPKGAIPIPSS